MSVDTMPSSTRATSADAAFSNSLRVTCTGPSAKPSSKFGKCTVASVDVLSSMRHNSAAASSRFQDTPVADSNGPTRSPPLAS